MSHQFYLFPNPHGGQNKRPFLFLTLMYLYLYLYLHLCYYGFLPSILSR